MDGEDLYLIPSLPLLLSSQLLQAALGLFPRGKSHHLRHHLPSIFSSRGKLGYLSHNDTPII